MSVCEYRDGEGGCNLPSSNSTCLHQEREEQWPYEMICTLEIEEMMEVSKNVA